jgi:hypothetical protein
MEDTVEQRLYEGLRGLGAGTGSYFKLFQSFMEIRAGKNQGSGAFTTKKSELEPPDEFVLQYSEIQGVAMKAHEAAADEPISIEKALKKTPGTESQANANGGAAIAIPARLAEVERKMALKLKAGWSEAEAIEQLRGEGFTDAELSSCGGAEVAKKEESEAGRKMALKLKAGWSEAEAMEQLRGEGFTDAELSSYGGTAPAMIPETSDASGEKPGPNEGIRNLLKQVVIIRMSIELNSKSKKGHSGLSSTVELKPGVTFLELAVRQVEYLNTKYAVDIPLVLVTSHRTHKALQRRLREYIDRKVQIRVLVVSHYPLILKEALLPLPTAPFKDASERDEEWAWYPAGVVWVCVWVCVCVCLCVCVGVGGWVCVCAKC